MKALLIAATLVALSSTASAGAASREAATAAAADTKTVVAMVDTSRIGSTGLTALNTAAPWQATGPSGPGFDAPAPEVDGGTLLIALGLAAVLLARPLGRALRRLEQQRRAAALASTLGHSSRG